MNNSLTTTLSDIVATRIHLDKQFEIESHHAELRSLKIDVIMSNKPISKGKSLVNAIHINSVFLYYLAYVLVGLALVGMV